MKPTTKISIALLLFALATGCSSAEPVADEEPIAGAEEDGTVDEQQEELAADEQQDDEMTADEEEVADPVRKTLKAAAEGDHRSEEDRTRNQYRNPVETLLFFGFESDQTVIELWPGTGWYTGVISPALDDDNPLRAGIFDFDEEDTENYLTQITLQYLDWIEEHQGVLGKVDTRTFAPPEVVELGEPESADLVVTFRNLHNQYQRDNLDNVLAAVYEVLKPGGTFGVVQHRAPAGSDPDETAEDGYLNQKFVIETIEDAGFVLEETSEINANPDDTADHPDGVWSLPPTLRGGEETAEEFLEIGESDRMTLRFVKPAE